ncbi:ribonuclease E/G [Brevundimonas sp. SL130]|uniref:ribonuclease E/G n=1 Tax=Brevundimonas sp. SL130 TaxID=2995143 RepID=UPI00226CC5D5|nr:ribonuclease E/G [Brevundimonas sp. SL130]WAC61413.1 ribonuclease E/G [Brevundimonas sp. SL130]
MSGEIEVFLDEAPGETRGAVMRDGRYTHLLIHRDSDPLQHRLGARSVGRVTEINPGLRGAFVDLGSGVPAFLPFYRNERLTQGERLEATVVAEPRAGKGAVLRRLGPGEGAPRLLEAAPSIAAQVRDLAEGVGPTTGLAAIDAVAEAEEEALAPSHAFASHGIDLAIERTRALIAVDIDHTAGTGRDPKQARAAANRLGLNQAARLIGLRNWGGLIVIDLVGGAEDAAAGDKAARMAFTQEPQAVFGPISRFGLLQMSLPWRRTPIEEILFEGGRRPSVQTEVLALARALRRRLLSDTQSPSIVVRCAPEEAAILGPLAARIGPRASVRADAAVRRGCGRIEGPDR